MESEPTNDMRVFVYRNLHKGRGGRPVYSVQSRERIGGVRYGIVVHHTPEITLRDCTFCVRKSGLLQVRATKSKNVHAGIVGRIIAPTFSEIGGMTIRYDPYLHDTFTTDQGDEIVSAARVTIGSELVGDRWRTKILAFF